MQGFRAPFVLASAFALALASLPASASPKLSPAPSIPGLADSSFSQGGQGSAPDSAMAALIEMDKRLSYRTGEIKLDGGLATLKLPEGYRYLDAKQSQTVLTSFWGNPPDIHTLGMIWAPGQEPLGEGSWAVIIQSEAEGYVKDDDAEKIDYEDLLKTMKKSTEENNKERVKQGYSAMHLLGWAEKPYYDKAAHKLHWAKELRAEGSDHNSLNYDIRILGRRGVLILTAVATMRELATVKAGMPPVLAAVEFDPGNRYSEFDPKIDKVATYGIAALVAGGVLAKVGFFKLLLIGLLAAKKFIVIGLLAVVAFFRRLFKGPAAQKETAEVTRPLPESEKRQG
ncbi:MAG: DUF2167 domain-containing protein [Fibrobacteres bacterium]|nr:DUF2167 domain-containing protein [Fibrobacterota bacterium]